MTRANLEVVRAMYDVRDGRISCVTLYPEPAEALAAAGLAGDG